MSKDIASIIFDLIKNDRTLEGLELKEMYKRKIKNDAEDLRTALKDLIADRIKTSYQPLNNKLELCDDMILGGTPRENRTKCY